MTMPFDLVTIPCLSDNYAFLLHSEGGRTALIDAPAADPVIAELDQRGWALNEIWLTHHHHDHIAAVDALRGAYPEVKLTGAAADARRLPSLDREVSHGESFDFDGAEVQVIDVSGHTIGHIAFHVPAANAVFTGDSLMALGCGRLFEGSPSQMWRSLGRIAKLPDDTLVCSGHEYTATNARFALTIEPDNDALQQRAQDTRAAVEEGRPTVPSLISLEKATNPFLRAGLSDVKEALNMQEASDVETFAEIRRRKDVF
jgi:hydroxyacylglutathione hydrolase